MGPMDVSCEHSVFLSYGAGADPRPSARNGSVHTYTSFHITLLGACVFVTGFVEFYVTYTNSVIGHILWLPLSTASASIGGYISPH